MKLYDVTIKLPALVYAEDYHDFRDIQETLRQVMRLQIFVDEVCFDYNERRYVGVVYENLYPGDEIVKKLLDHHNINTGD